MANSKFSIRNIRSFWRRTEKSEGCWTWVGCVDRDGYGQIGVNYRQLKAHRFSWELHYSVIPEGLCVCHRCDNPGCVNPEHLFLGTNQENTRDKLNKGRQQQGQQAGGKLTTEEVAEVRRLLSEGRTTVALAKEYGVSQGNISHIKLGRTRRIV